MSRTSSTSPGETGHATSCGPMSYRCGMTRTPARRLTEVAQKVGVSEATVSRVLNGRPGVSDSTREAVLTALDVLGYERRPSCAATARLVGLVLPELQNPIFPAFAEVVGGALAQRGFTRCSAPGRPAASPRPTTWRCCWTSRSPGGVRRRALR